MLDEASLRSLMSDEVDDVPIDLDNRVGARQAKISNQAEYMKRAMKNKGYDVDAIEDLEELSES